VVTLECFHEYRMKDDDGSDEIRTEATNIGDGVIMTDVHF